MTLDEANTPVEEIEYQGQKIYLKREDKNPNRSFKDRSIAYQLSYYYQKGYKDFVISSSGNSAVSAIAYACLANLNLKVFLSTNTPEYKKVVNCVPNISNLHNISIHECKKPKSDAIKYAIKHKCINLRGSTDKNAIIGFSSLGFELQKQVPNADALFICCSSGTSTMGIFSSYEYNHTHKSPTPFRTVNNLDEEDIKYGNNPPLSPLHKGARTSGPNPVKGARVIDPDLHKGARTSNPNPVMGENTTASPPVKGDLGGLRSTPIHTYQPYLKQYARENRHNPTESEKRLWYEILCNRNYTLGYKFTRQKPIDNFILDFYCSKLQLTIEIDGDSHIDEKQDISRDTELRKLGIKTIRYNDSEILDNLDNVYIDLESKLRDREYELERKTPLSPLHKGARTSGSNPFKGARVIDPDLNKGTKTSGPKPVMGENITASPPVKGDLGGLINSLDLSIPNFHIVQTSKIHPIAKEFDKNFEISESSLANAVCDNVAHRKSEIVDIVKKTKGNGWVISDEDLKKAKQILISKGINLPGYNAYVSFAGYLKAIKSGLKFNNPVCIISGI